MAESMNGEDAVPDTRQWQSSEVMWTVQTVKDTKQNELVH